MSLATIYNKIIGLENRVSELEGLVKILSSSHSKINQNIDSPLSLPDGEEWDCAKCGSNLGFMDCQLILKKEQRKDICIHHILDIHL